VISPLLANIFLHYVLDEWFVKDVRPRMRGRCFLVRYADDFVIGFEQEQDAHRVMDVLPKRFNRFGLSVHPEKTKLVRFGRPSGDGKPERNGTFDFLGFTHFWSKSRRGNWVIKKKTMGKRVSRFVKAIWQWCRHKRHEPLREQHKALCVKLRGYYQYYAVRHNSRALNDVLYHVKRAWQYWLSKRSHRGIVIWDYFERYLIKKYPLPRPRIIHQI
jgi:RNA-directed DNA polymerase